MRSNRRNEGAGRWVLLGLLALAATWMGGALVQADNPDAAARGKIVFRVYCANCHGTAARGDGGLAKLLTVPPPDLTRIARRHEGEFPAAWVEERIDGREPLTIHGWPEMPVWGLSFRNPDNPGDQEAEVGAKLADLVEYLRSVQEEPEVR